MILRKMTDREIDELIDKDIIELLGFAGEDKKKIEELKEKMIRTVENRFWERVYQILKEKQLIEKFKNAGDEEEKQRVIFQEAGINPEGMFLEEALLLKVQLKTASDFFDQTAKAGEGDK